MQVKASENSRITEEILEEARNGPNGPLWYQQEYECQFVADEFCLFDDDRINKAISDDFEAIDAENY
jgi:hypothetical protein